MMQAFATTTARPGSGRPAAQERQRRLQTWAAFIERELAARGMRPGQLAAYANVNASTVSVWRHGKCLPSREAVLGVARCFRLPVEIVAQEAGLQLSNLPAAASRFASDPEWRALIAAMERLPPEQFAALKQALRHVLNRCRAEASAS
jgi:hypothetical protein